MYFNSLVENFEELRKEAGPIGAARFVKEEKTGETTAHDDNEKWLECPTPDFSKWQYYYKYCRSSGGVKVSANKNKGNLKVEPIDEESSLSIPSWGAYQAFWKKEYPNLCMSRPLEQEDSICSYCYTFQNSFRYKKVRSPEEEGVNAALVVMTMFMVKLSPALTLFPLFLIVYPPLQRT
jgi:hypothetical protein